MIQELLGGAGLIGGERKISISGTILEGTPSSSPSPSSLSPSSSTTVAAATANSNTTSTSENLRCPRCDSPNTKFCYYNNYNLTQPRHFCKTCRRYWTKGGALRNVPIGGGCRKNKNTNISTSVGKTNASKMKTMVSEIGRSSFGNTGYDHELSSSPIMWASPQSSHLLTLLRASHGQNPNPNTTQISNSFGVKEEGCLIGTHTMTEPISASGSLNARTLGLDPVSQVPSLGLCSPFWKSNHHQSPGFIVGEAQNSGIQELYQRLRSSTNNYYSSDSSSTVLLNNVGSSSTSSSSTILESSPIAGGEMGYWNPTFSSWSDLPTPNGAYP